jgi:hypothetical protein
MCTSVTDSSSIESSQYEGHVVKNIKDMLFLVENHRRRLIPSAFVFEALSRLKSSAVFDWDRIVPASGTFNILICEIIIFVQMMSSGLYRWGNLYLIRLHQRCLCFRLRTISLKVIAFGLGTRFDTISYCNWWPSYATFFQARLSLGCSCFPHHVGLVVAV